MNLFRIALSRRTAALVVGASLCAAACQNGTQHEITVRASPDTPASAESQPKAMVRAVPNTDRAEFDVAGVHMTVTLADAEAIKAALLARLAQQKDLAERDELIKSTQQVAPSIDDGVVRIGTWILQAHGRKLALTYRLLPVQGAPSSPMFRAEVVKNGSTWAVQDVNVGEVRAR
jgi:hypothetical protein